jgi:UDP:flavonoid glycosyltransferase YjiC (YdhE family)
MGTVIFAMLPEPGHLNPSFKLAKTLQRRGHSVIYIGAQDSEAELRRQGFEFIAMFKEELPLGYQEEIALSADNDPTFKGDASIRNLIADQMKIIYAQKQEIIEMVKRFRPSLFIVDNLLPVMALVAHEIGVPSIFLNVTFNAFDNYQGTTSLLPIQRVPELVLCPQDFDLPGARYGVRRRFYIEPSIDLDRSEVAFAWERISKDKPLIYCSLGTQSHFYKQESRLLYHCLFATMSARPDWQLILSIGSHLSTELFADHPPNVVVVNRAPQLEVLKRAFVMITHGGLGSIKECILMAVPMIVFPLGRDQPRNGARVAFHRLGVRGDIRNVSVEVIQSLIDRIDRDPTFKECSERFGKKFREMEEANRGVKIIEKIMDAFDQKGAGRTGLSAKEEVA